ncbi:MAG: hypothetical protein Q8O14_05505 [bacterium]|nr:hypothetical protein [bacterium]
MSRTATREARDRELLAGLEEAARTLGFTVRTERGSFRSGRCRSRDEQLIILNRRLSLHDRSLVLARILAGEDLERAFLLPAVREQITRLAAGGREVQKEPEAREEAS